MNKFLSFIIANAHAQDLIACEDGTYADPTVGCTEVPAAIVTAQSDILSIILKVADAIVNIVVAGAAIALIFGGIMYVTSLGSDTKLQKAKNIVFWSLFGLVVAVLAKYIVTAILALISQ